MGQKTMFFLRIKRRLVKKSENLNKWGQFSIILLLPVMLKFTVQFSSVHLFTCVAKAVTSRRPRECSIISSGCEVLYTVHIHLHCTVTIVFYTTGSVPSGPVLSVLPMVCLYQLKNCCLKMWQCKSSCKLLLLLTALWLYCLASSQLYHSTQTKFICKSQLITGYFLSTEAGPVGGELVSL